IFQSRPKYPKLNFSVLNGSRRRMQITSLKAIKGASVKDNHTGLHFFTGPRLKLEYSLKDAKDGDISETLGEQVSNLEPGEAEAFSISLECENTVNLLDLEVEYINATSDRANICYPNEIIV